VRTAHLVVWSVANPDEDYVAGPEVAITVPPPVRRFRLRLSRWVVVGLIGLVVVVASAAAAVAVQRSFATILPTRVTVPDLTGTLRADLAKELGEYLVPGTITAQATGDRPFGTVITQLPAAGTLVPPGSTVAVTVEDGVRMPKVLGQSTSAAQAAVQALPLRLAQVVPLAEASEEPLGTVVRQDPPADAVVAAGALVTLTELAAVTVPDLSGATLSEATARLAGLGLVLDPPASAKPGGRITVQNPVSGTGVRAGTKVHVLVEAPQ
jgi:serine/threonine-protein kinase